MKPIERLRVGRGRAGRLTGFGGLKREKSCRRRLSQVSINLTGSGQTVTYIVGIDQALANHEPENSDAVSPGESDFHSPFPRETFAMQALSHIHIVSFIPSAGKSARGALRYEPPNQ